MNSNLIEAKFALWGPRASGKDWMIKSFARSLQQYNNPQDKKKYDKEFEHILLDEAGKPVTLQAPDKPIPATPTGMPEDTVFLYSRTGRRKSKSHILSSHVHEIVITNASGEDLVKGTVHPVNYGIQKAACLLLLLDHTQIEYGQFTPSQYVEEVNKLFDGLEPIATGLQSRFLAACVTKTDLLKTKRDDPFENIEMYFGPDMKQVLEAHANVQGSKLKVFSVSSFGFLRSGEPNFGFDEQHLKDLSAWRPINVEQPFFWLFENMERDRLKYFESPLAKFLYSDERQKMYLPYPG